MMQEKKTLYAFETKDDVDFFLKQSSFTPDDWVVALSAQAKAALERHEIIHTSIEDYYDEAALMRAAVNSNQVIAELCSELDRLMGVSIGGVLPPFSAYYYAGRLRILRDNFLHASFVLEAVITKIKPDRVHLVGTSAANFSEVWVMNVRFYSWVLKEICEQSQIETHCFHQVVDAVPRLSFRDRMSGSIRRIKNMVRLALCTKADLAYYLWPNMPQGSLKKANVDVFRMPSAPLKGAKLEAPDLKTTWEYFSFGVFKLGALADVYLKAYVTQWRALHEACLKQYETIVRNKNIRLGVVSAALTLEPVALMIALRRAQKQTVALQHGGFVGYCDWTMVPLIDFNANEHYFAYGPGVNSALRSTAEIETPIRAFPVTLHEVGSSSVYDLIQHRKNETNEKPRVLYVTTFLSGPRRYLGGHLRPDIRYLRTQKAVLETLGRYSESWETYFRPPPHPSQALMLEGASENITLCTEGDLVSLLKNVSFDLVVTDSVTTVLLEVIATNTNVVTWFDTDVMNLSPEGEKLLEKRADVAFSYEEYLALIEQALQKKAEKQSENDIDDSFLMKYALSEGSAPNDRCAELLLEILEKDKIAD